MVEEEEEVEGVVVVVVIVVVVGEDKRNNKSNFLIFVYMFYSTSCTGTYHIIYLRFFILSTICYATEIRT